MRTVPVAVAFAVLALAVACVGIAQLMRALHGAENSTPYESPATFWNDVRPATAGDPHHQLRHVLNAVIDDVVGNATANSDVIHLDDWK